MAEDPEKTVAVKMIEPEPPVITAGDTSASIAVKVLAYVIGKLLSARFLAAVAVVATLCMAVHRCFDLVNAPNLDEKALAFRKEVFMYVMGSFTAVVTSVITLYFTRTDRVGGNEAAITNGEGGHK